MEIFVGGGALLGIIRLYLQAMTHHSLMKVAK